MIAATAIAIATAINTAINTAITTAITTGSAVVGTAALALAPAFATPPPRLRHQLRLRDFSAVQNSRRDP